MNGWMGLIDSKQINLILNKGVDGFDSELKDQ